jgi:hypothetical protein
VMPQRRRLLRRAAGGSNGEAFPGTKGGLRW